MWEWARSSMFYARTINPCIVETESTTSCRGLKLDCSWCGSWSSRCAPRCPYSQDLVNATTRVTTRPRTGHECATRLAHALSLHPLLRTLSRAAAVALELTCLSGSCVANRGQCTKVCKLNAANVASGAAEFECTVLSCDPTEVRRNTLDRC